MFFSMFKPGDVREKGDAYNGTLWFPKYSTLTFNFDSYTQPMFKEWSSSMILELGGGCGGSGGSWFDSNDYNVIGQGGAGSQGELIMQDVGFTSFGIGVTLGGYGGDGASASHNMQFGPFPNGTTGWGGTGYASGVSAPHNAYARGGCGGGGVTYDGWTSTQGYNCVPGFPMISGWRYSYVKIKWM